MTPTQARAFFAVAAEGSFTKAAHKLGVSQPTVTSHVKQLEAVCKIELFHRTGRGAKLTPTGENLYRIVRRMFGCYEEATAYLEDVAGMRRGHLRVGSYGPYDVMRMLARFQQSYPGIGISAVYANSDSLSRQVLDYEIDVAVLGRTDYPDSFSVLPFSSPPLIVIAPRNDIWAGRSLAEPAALANERLIMREPGSAARHAFERVLLEAGITNFHHDEFGSREGVVSAVAAGMGVGAIFDEGPVPEAQVVKLPIAGAVARSHVDVVCLDERRGSPTLRAFLTIAERLLAPQGA